MAIMQAVTGWRRQGILVCYTIDAGPNVHVICEAGEVEIVEARLREIPGVLEVIPAFPGMGARLVS